MSTLVTARVERMLPAPPSAVYERWVDAERLAEFICPAPGRANVQADPRVGGELRIEMVFPNRTRVIEAAYLALDPPHRLVLAWRQLPAVVDSVVTVTFEEAAGAQTLMTITHSRLPEPERESYRGGWGRIADQLARVAVHPYDVRAIGLVRSALRATADAPNQAFQGAPEARLEIDPAFAEALHLIEPGDELIVVTWLHRADRRVLQTHPMGDESLPLTGVFRTRSPDRPNPIGLHRVKVTARDGETALVVGALEAIDGTPILDLKVAMRAAQDA